MIVRAGKQYLARQIVSWVSVFAGFIVAHMVGDYLFQTDWQALNKRGGLTRPAGSRALLSHVTTYTLAFVPAFIWIGSELDVGWALVAAVMVFIPHLIIDDGRLVRSTSRASSGSRASISASRRRSTSPSTCSRCGSWRCSWGPREPPQPPPARPLLVVAMVLVVGAGIVLEATARPARRRAEHGRPALPRPRHPGPALERRHRRGRRQDVQRPRGALPFNRRWDARVIRQLTKAKAAAIAYDFQFTEKRPTRTTRLIVAVRAARNVVLATTEVSKAGKTNIFGGAGKNGGLPYSRGIPANSNYRVDPDDRIRRLPFSLQRLVSFPIAAATTALGHKPKLPSGNTPGSTSRALRPPSPG